jgi:hypothetical protein
MRNARPSTETTPPPLQSQQSSHQVSQGSGTIYTMGNDIMVQNMKNFEDVSFVEKSAHKHKIIKERMNINKDN